MPYRTLIFQSASKMDTFLNGGVMGGAAIMRGTVHGLHNKTLIINSATVTFSDASGAGLNAAAIKAAIEGAASGTTVTWVDGKLVISHASGVTVDADGTANTQFGFSSETDSVGVPYNGPGGTAPCILFIGASPDGASYSVTVEDA